VRLVIVSGATGLALEEWVRQCVEVAAEGVADVGDDFTPVSVESFFSHPKVGTRRKAEATQGAASVDLERFLRLPPSELGNVCSDAFDKAVDSLRQQGSDFAVLCWHPVLFQGLTRTFVSPYRVDRLARSLVAGIDSAIIVSIHDDLYDVRRRLQGTSADGKALFLHPRHHFEDDGTGKLMRQPLRDLEQLMHLLDWRDRELMISKSTATSLGIRHFLFHRKGPVDTFWRVARNNSASVYFSHPIAQPRRDLLGVTDPVKSPSSDEARGTELRNGCNEVSAVLGKKVPLVEPTAIDEFRIDVEGISQLTSADLRRGCDVPPGNDGSRH
jgi:hypothetical protein